MKKIYYILTLLAFTIISTQVIAEVVTTRKVPASTTGSKLSNSIKACTPYSEKLKTEALGMKLDFNVKISGWSNNKCIVDFVGKTNGASNSFASVYGVSPSEAQLLTFEPSAHCEFTQQQLLSVGDSILQEEARSNGQTKMLKNPNDIDMTSFINPSDSDMALMDIVFNQGACKIKNISKNPINLNTILNF